MATTWTLTAHELPLRYTWKISRNASTAKTNLVVQATQADHCGQGEAAPNVRYAETPELLHQQFAALLAAGLPQANTLPELAALLAAHPVAHALSFALEAALTHCLAARAGQAVWQFLGVPRPAERVPTAFSLPIMEPGEVAGFIAQQQARRFSLLKIKVNQAQGLDLLRAVAQACPGHPLLVDGNEAWPDADSLLCGDDAVADAVAIDVGSAGQLVVLGHGARLGHAPARAAPARRPGRRLPLSAPAHGGAAASRRVGN